MDIAPALPGMWARLCTVLRDPTSPGLSNTFSASYAWGWALSLPSYLTTGRSGVPVAIGFSGKSNIGKHGSCRCERRKQMGHQSSFYVNFLEPRNSYSVTDVLSKHGHGDNFHPHSLLTWRQPLSMLPLLILLGLR